MNDKPDKALRAKALAQLKHLLPTEAPVNSAEELLHELRVHQIELEMQNEELRRTQVALEESRDIYMDLYEFAPVGHFTLTRSGMIDRVNLTGAALLGVDRKKLLGRRFAGFVNHEDSNFWHQHFLNVLQRDGRQSCELALRRNDGTLFHAQLSSLKAGDTLSSLKLDESSLQNSIANASPLLRITLTDISERKRIDEELRIAAIAFESQEGVMVTDANAVILRVNHAFTKLTGYSEHEAVGKTPAMLNSGLQNQAFYLRLWATLKQKQYWQGELWNRRKDGNIYPERMTISAVVAPDGNISHYIGAFFDITEIKRAEDNLRKSREQLLAFIRHAPISIAMFDRKMNYLASSGRWLAEYGRGYTDLTGHNHYEVHPDIPAEWKVVHQQALAGASLENKEDLWIQGDGSKHWLRWAALPWTDENAKIGGIIISTEDMTSQKIMEMEVSKRRNEMEYLQKKYLAAQTAAAIAHELNQPLLAISAYSEAALMLMKTEKPDLGKIYKAVEGSERQSHRAGQAIRKLLEFLSIKELSTEAFDLNEEIHSILNAARSEYELQFKHDLQLEKALPLIRANRIHVQKVLLNLLHNGVDAMHEAGVPLPAISVTVRTMKDENVAQVTIQDNGPGVKKEVFHRLFEPFYTTKIRGIGMGLSISRSLIEENGGQLWVDPQEGPGATFHITLPFAS
ncbi:MAG: PAS domain S-box protein [Gallionella sp.]|jgi:PAS domain S-box-containing protein